MRLGTQRGFTLVELMVGLALGLLTTLVITEVLAMSEGKRRTLAMGGDAQVNGALALYTLQRDVQMAGYGAAIDPAALGCPIKGEFKDPAATEPGVPFVPALAPVVIEDGANGAPDKITVLQSRKASFSAPAVLSDAHAKTDSVFLVKSTLGIEAGDLMVAVPKNSGWGASGWCTVFDVTDDGAATPTDTTLTAKRIPHVSGNSKWNRSTVFPDTPYEKGDYLLNLGTLSQNTYSIDARNNLSVIARTSGALASADNALYPQIVNLQAMYGKDSSGDGEVDSYDTTSPTTTDGWQRVLSIRVALVARSNQYEKDKVTLAAPLWDVGSGGTDDCHGTTKGCLKLKIDHIPDWEHYRYKVYETIVPLRNVLWNSGKSPL